MRRVALPDLPGSGLWRGINLGSDERCDLHRQRFAAPQFGVSIGQHLMKFLPDPWGDVAGLHPTAQTALTDTQCVRKGAFPALAEKCLAHGRE
jgi:hypothetical protein